MPHVPLSPVTRRQALQRLAGAGLVLQPPYVNRNESPLRYEGPGGDEPEPEGLTEVLLGYFGPSDEAHPEGGAFWTGASRAITELNRDGGYKGLPFRLVAKWTDSPWTAGARLVAEMAFRDQVWGIVGSIDAAATHLAEQVAVKARVVLIDPASTDRTVNAAMVPWMFSCLPGDPAVAAALAPCLEREAGAAGPTLIASTGHDERHLAAEFRRYFASRSPGIAHVLEFEPGLPAGVLSRLPDTRAVLVLANTADTAHLVRALRGTEHPPVVYAGPSAARARFVALAGGSAEGVRCPRLSPPASLQPGTDYPSLAAYDAVRLLAAAVRRGGLNRIRICRSLADLPPWQGAAGTLTWSHLNRNSRPVTPAVIRLGALEDFSVPASLTQ